MFLIVALAIFIALSGSSCERPDLIPPAGFTTVIEADTILFAQIGDFGYAGEDERKVSEMVKSWHPDFIISAGDNNYTNGKYSTLITNITNYYGDYIYNYDAPSYYRCHGKAFNDQMNRFFPTPGNHDSDNKDGLIPYYNYFTLPGNEVYYKFSWGPVTFYSINCVDGNADEQKTWLADEVASSITPFNIAFFHYPPYCSGSHGNTPSMEWDFYSMGIDIVFSGHDHIYQRIEKKDEQGLFYIVNGLGGKATGWCSIPLPEDSFTSFCYGADYGAVKCTATRERLVLDFYAVSDPQSSVDHLEITKAE